MGISTSTIARTTDNGSNFVIAFQEFGEPRPEDTLECVEISEMFEQESSFKNVRCLCHLNRNESFGRSEIANFEQCSSKIPQLGSSIKLLQHHLGRNARDKKPTLEAIKKGEYPEMERFYYEAYKNERPSTVEINTSIAKRTKAIFWHDPDLQYIFIRSQAMQEYSNHHLASLCIKMDTTFKFCADYVLTQLQVETLGGFPLCYFIHKKQLTHEFLLMFDLLFESNPTPFNGNVSPKFILTDDSRSERKAIQIAFRQATNILCQIHLKRNIKAYKVEKGKQRFFEKLANAVISVKSTDEAKFKLQELATSGIDGEGYKLFTNRLMKDSDAMLSAFRDHDCAARLHSTNRYFIIKCCYFF
ncbi:hypothetical protein Ciccas_009528 [Cichlidogyrus casuarinus]|uniref:MULE transposase domain-containing protein n=1 Tax=Cichlidogyrus casuarinus TaxID=1844966 RepID=A0ABD2PWS8_9PLAT